METEETLDAGAATESDVMTDVTADAALGSDAEEMLGEEEIEAVYNTIFDLIEVEWLSGLLTILFALVFTAIIAHACTKLLRRILSHDSTPLPSSSIFINIARVIIWAIGLSVILQSFTPINVSSAIAALGIGGIAISLGFQDTLSNLIGGLQLSIMGIVEPGDHVRIGSERGVVSDVTWRHTTIRNFSGEEIIIPNAVINSSTLVKLPPLSKIVVPVSVTTEGQDLDALAQAIQKATDEAVERITPVISPSVLVFNSITEFGFAANVIVYVADGTLVNQVKDAVVRATALLTRTAATEAVKDDAKAVENADEAVATGDGASCADVPGIAGGASAE